MGRYTGARAHALRERYRARFGGPELPVPVESIAEDLLGLTIRADEGLEVSGILLPAAREIVLSAAERDYPGRSRFPIAHELGHWMCHVAGVREAAPVYCRAADVEPGADRALEREASIFAAERPMPEGAVRRCWDSTASAEDIAAALAVSPLAARWRLFSFGLLGQAPA